MRSVLLDNPASRLRARGNESQALVAAQVSHLVVSHKASGLAVVLPVGGMGFLDYRYVGSA
jgi:hypothetical protein